MSSRNGRWALRWDTCQSCQTTDAPHEAHGLCRPCYTKLPAQRAKRDAYAMTDRGKEALRKANATFHKTEKGRARNRRQNLSASARANRQRWIEANYEYVLARARRAAHRRRERYRHGSLSIEQELAIRSAASTCPLCSIELTDMPRQPNSKHLDHIVQLALGGDHSFENVRILCATCNLSRPRDGRDLERT